MVLSRLLRAGEHKTVRRLRAIADHINSLEGDVATDPTRSCGPRPTSSRSAYADGESLDELLPEAFAVVREAAKRTLGPAALRRAARWAVPRCTWATSPR